MENNYPRHLLAVVWFAMVCVGSCPQPLQAQHRQPYHTLSFKPNYGLDLAKSNQGERNYLYGLHVSYDKNISGSTQDWVNILNAKSVSFGVLWHNMDHIKEVVEDQAYPLGQAFGLLTEVDFQLFNIGPVNVLFTPGVGLTYITETIFTQPSTSTVGSHLNMALTAELGLDIPLSERLSLSAAANVLHYSNGGIKIPNGGINTVNGSIGLKTAIGNPPRLRPTEKKTLRQIEGSSGEIVIGMGQRGKYRTHDSFLRTGVYGGYNYYLNQAVGFKAGVDMVYYHSVFRIEDFDGTFQYYGSSYDRIRLGASVGAEVAMGRFAVSGQGGRYIHFNSFHGIMWYWTSALRYYITPNIGVQSTLYMHHMQADYVNWGLAFKI